MNPLYVTTQYRMTHQLVFSANVIPPYDVHKNFDPFPCCFFFVLTVIYVLATLANPLYADADVLRACPFTLSEESDLRGRDRGSRWRTALLRGD